MYILYTYCSCSPHRGSSVTDYNLYIHDYIHCTLYYLRFVDFGEGKKPEYLAENPRSTGDINHRNSIDSREIPRWSWLSKNIGLKLNKIV